MQSISLSTPFFMPLNSGISRPLSSTRGSCGKKDITGKQSKVCKVLSLLMLSNHTIRAVKLKPTRAQQLAPKIYLLLERIYYLRNGLTVLARRSQQNCDVNISARPTNISLGRRGIIILGDTTINCWSQRKL